MRTVKEKIGYNIEVVTMPKFVVVEFDGLSGDTSLMVVEGKDEQEVYDDFDDCHSNLIVCSIEDFAQELRKIAHELEVFADLHIG